MLYVGEKKDYRFEPTYSFMVCAGYGQMETRLSSDGMQRRKLPIGESATPESKYGLIRMRFRVKIDFGAFIAWELI